ncbi:MAG: disulfide reductase [Aquificae bacterium]|nr:disulfide reductase [Aquificota bacterium]
MKQVGFYQGCCFQGPDAHMFDMLKKVFADLGVDIKLVERTTCCGGNTIDEANKFLVYSINARNIALAEAEGLDLLVSCNTCYMVLAKTKHALDNDPQLREEINKLLAEEGLEYKGTAKIWHILPYLVEEVGVDTIRKKVKRPLKGWKVATYYGCHIKYPKEVAVVDSENPSGLEELVEALGAEPVKDYEGKDACCGYHAYYTNKPVALKKVVRAPEGAKKAGAEMLVTPCPLCFKAQDIYQDMVENAPRVPSVYLPELLAYALGYDPKEAGLAYHIIPVDKVTVNAPASS